MLFCLTGLGFFPPAGPERRQVRYECLVCGRTFSNVYNLKVHLRDQHAGLGAARCDVCGLSFKNLSTLRVHKSNYHRRPHPAGGKASTTSAPATPPSTTTTPTTTTTTTTTHASGEPRLHA